MSISNIKVLSTLVSSLLWGGNESAKAFNVSTDLCLSRPSCTRQSLHIAICMHYSVPNVVQHRFAKA